MRRQRIDTRPLLMALAEDFAEVLAELEDQLPQTFGWPVDTANPQVEYPCFASGFRKGKTLESGGWAIDQNGIVIVRASLFATTKPAIGHKISFEGNTYRISDVLTAPNSAFLRLTVVNDSRGA